MKKVCEGQMELRETDLTKVKERGKLTANKKIKWIIVSLSSVALLAACGNDTANDSLGTTPVPPETIEETEMDDAGGTAVDDDTEESTPEEGTDATDDSTNVEETEVSDDIEETSDTSEAQLNDSDSPGIENIEFPISIQDAIDIFNNEFGSPNIDEIQFEREDGRYVYDFAGWDGEFEYEMEIDAQTGEILSQEVEADTEHDDILDLDGIISPQEAMAIALEAAGAGYVEEWDLELEDGFTVYEVDIEGGEDQDVDAHTGDIR